MEMAMASDTCLRLKQNSNFRCSHCTYTYSSRETFLQHLNCISSGCASDGIAKHDCGPCSVTFDTVGELIDHLDTYDIHTKSLHNFACQGISSELRKYLFGLDSLNQRCQSHRSEYSLAHMGYSPLHCATMNGFFLCAVKLLKWGANPNLQDEIGSTPLHLAMAKGNVKIIMRLLRHGGDLFRKDHAGKSPFDLANAATNLKVLMNLFYFEEKDGKYVPTQVKNPDIAYRVVEHYSKSHGEPLNENAAEDTITATSSCVVKKSSLKCDRAFLAKVFEMFLDHDITKRTYYDVINHCKERVSHFKLLVLGDVAAGKTSLVRTLSGKEFCAERHATDGIDSSFLETVSIDDSWHEICDKDSMFNSVVAKSFIAKLGLEKVVEKLSDEVCSNLTDDFERRLSLKDENSNDGTVAILCKDSETIAEPVKGLIQECLESDKKIQDNQFKVTILDFAGHTLYLPMHHIFLNAKALYLVCFNLQEHKRDPKGTMKQLRFWLNSVVAHKGLEPAIFLVGTHSDSIEKDDIEKANEDIRGNLYDRFMNCFILNEDKLFFPIENSKGPHDVRATNLKKLIQREAQTLGSESDDEVSIKWLRCEKFIHETVLKDLRLFSLTKKDLRQKLESFCEEFDDEDYQKMLEFFHDGGIIWLPELLVTKEESIGRFSDLVIINIQHLMDCMTNVFKLALDDSSKAPRLQRRAAKSLQESAKISHEDLKKALADTPAPADDVIELLAIYHVVVPAERINTSDKVDLMVPCQTSTPKRKTPSDDTAKLYIIPSLLPETDLNEIWNKYLDHATERIFFIDFYDFACEALFHQLLVRLAEQSTRVESIDPVIRKFDGIFGWYDVLCYRLVYYSEECVLKGAICKLPQDKTGCYDQLLTFLKDIINEICEDFFRSQKFRLMIPCSSPECESDATFSFVSQIARELPNAHLIECNPKFPKQEFCGRNRINFSDGAYGIQPRSNSLNSNVANGDHQDLQQSISVDSGVDEPSSAPLMKVNLKAMTYVSDHIGSSWHGLARHLNWPNNVDVASLIREIDTDLHNVDVKDRAFSMLDNWSNTLGKSATLDLLEKALIDCGKTDLSQKLREFTFA